MKKLLLFSFFTGIISSCFSQFIYMKTEEMAKMKDETIAVALTDDEELNKGIESFMAASWTASKYKVIKRSELPAYTKSAPKNYVITHLDPKSKLTSSNFARNTGAGKDQITYREDHVLLLKDVNNPSKIKTTEALYKAFIDFELEEASGLAECIRQLLQINAVLNFPGLKDNQLGVMKQIMNYPTKDEKRIVDKELWVAPSDVDIDAGKVDKVYPHKYKVVSKEQIAEAIKSKEKNVVYLAYVKLQAVEDLKLGGKTKEQTLYVIHDAESGQILALLNGAVTFDYRYFDYIAKTAQKPKK